MSRAFVKEENSEPWVPPTPPRAYRLTWPGPDGAETVHETDDLLAALRWLAARDRPGLELRDHSGALLATLTA